LYLPDAARKMRRTRAGINGECAQPPRYQTPNPEQMRDLPPLSPEQPVIIAGPTASGKSELALRIAEAQGGVIVNADALQVYGCWQVLSARPGADDLARAPHALYGHIGRDTPYSVGHWLRELAPICAGRARPIVVGGTGLYLSAATTGLSDVPAIPPQVRAQADALRNQDFARMQQDLRRDDPDLAARIDMANPMRVQRGWEVFAATARPLSAWQADKAPALLPRADTACFVLDAPKEWLSPRIEARFDQMMEKGALEEVRANAPHWQPGAPWTRAIGAPELIEGLAGRITLDEAVRLAKISTQQFAKRQRTWFRARMSDWSPIVAQML